MTLSKTTASIGSAIGRSPPREVRLRLDSEHHLPDRLARNQLQVLPQKEGILLRASGTDPCVDLPEFPFENASAFLLNIEVSVPADTILSIFCLTAGRTEGPVVQANVKGGRNTIHLKVPNNGLEGCLRLAPGRIAGDYVLHSLEVQALPSDASLIAGGRTCIDPLARSR
jgi:hypothetical protein